MKDVVMAVVAAGALVLSADGSSLAAGKMGGAGGMDAHVISLLENPDDAGDDTDCPTTQGGKLGIGAGDE